MGYLERKEEIEYVKKHFMPFSNGVQEARDLVEAMELTVKDQDIGNELDPEYEQEVVECRDGNEEAHPDFIQVDPENLGVEGNLKKIKKMLRGIELKSSEELLAHIQ